MHVDNQPANPASVDVIQRLEAMARQWDRCAANAPESTYLVAGKAEQYRGYAAGCRARIAEIQAAR